MVRRFVNVVAENYRSGMYSLHRLDVSKHLFYPSTAQAQELPAANGHGDAQPRMPETLHELQLPPPCMSFQPSPTNQWLNPRLSFFGLVSPRSSNGSRILCINKAGHAALYDADSQSVGLMPTLPGTNGPRPVSISVAREGEDGEEEEEELYIFHCDPGMTSGSGCFRVLLGSGTTWHWQPLPPPPFLRSPWYDPASGCSYAVVDAGRTICMSPRGDMGGTYCFDTVGREWKQQAGGWALPFLGGAEYVPDLDLWLGFDPRSPHYLCGTSDLSSTAMDRPPKLQYVWRDLDTRENWSAPERINLINLGAGRFCVAKQVFVVEPESAGYYDDWHTVESQFAVLTGIEISPTASCGGDHQEDNSNKKDLRQGLRVFKHHSILYHFMDDGLEWVL